MAHRGLRAALIVAVMSAAGCSQLHDTSVYRVPTSSRADKPGGHAVPGPVTARQLDGRSFPDRVIALTFDDGPDQRTLELARFLKSERVSATFFVVGRWDRHVSADPGAGRDIYRTGYEEIPILGEMVRLGQRIGNHTQNHALLSRVSPEAALRQLSENQKSIDAFEPNELRMFRVPGGDWNETLARSVDSDPSVRDLVGPVRWDIDEKDWQSSLECRSERAAAECEALPHSGALRLKAAVTARRYLDSVERAGRGIILLHDRVGDVGSRYALEVAHALVPALKAKGYVFVSPVLGFSRLRQRAFQDSQTSSPTRTSAREEGHSGERREDRGSSALPSFPADVDGDGRLDSCAETEDGIFCGLSRGDWFAAPERWSHGSDFGASDPRAWLATAAYRETIRFADINGDGRADVCGRAKDGIVCALSTGRDFTAATTWRDTGMTDADGWLDRDPASIQLTDVNGDDHADLCVVVDRKRWCGLSP